MWTSPIDDNPWLPFCDLNANQNHGYHIEDHPRNKDYAQRISPRCSSPEVQVFMTTDTVFRHIEEDIVDQQDVNGNMNVYSEDINSNIHNVLLESYKQTQDAGVCGVNPERHVCNHHILVNKDSLSLDTSCRKSTVMLHESHILEVSTNISAEFKQFVLTDHTDIRYKDINSPEDSVSPEIRTRRSEFQTCYYAIETCSNNNLSEQCSIHTKEMNDEDSSVDMSPGTFSDRSYRSEYCSYYDDSPLSQEMYMDLESDQRNTICTEIKKYSRQEWSPVHADPDDVKMKLFYDYRQIYDECSFTSEKSCYSTTSEEADDNYEIVEWRGDYANEEHINKRKSDIYNTPPTSPTMPDTSALEGYHTAPNSPLYTSDVNNVCAIDVSNRYCKSPEIKHMGVKFHDNNSTDIISNIGRESTMQNKANNANTYDQNHGCKVSNSASPTLEALPTECVEILIKAKHTTNGHNKKGNFEPNEPKPSVSIPDVRTLLLETPPFISVNSMHYEGDPETGRAKVIGRGSFGCVLRARFSDKMYYHLPVVIKEFKEELTNPKEIIDEARKLHYLHDTGYVPICYGLMCFGSPGNPKYGIVQEYVGEGFTLEQILWGHYDLPLEYWFRIVVQCCKGLARFHHKQILLNDIKSNNIIPEFGKNSVRIRYVDFGLATDMRGKMYKNTQSLENFVYLAPEVRRDGQVTTVATDIYSLGYMLEQISKYAKVHELTVIARMCMAIDPDVRLPVLMASKLVMDHMSQLGYDPLISWEIY